MQNEGYGAEENFLTVKLEAAGIPKTYVYADQLIRRHIEQNCDFNTHRDREHKKS